MVPKIQCFDQAVAPFWSGFRAQFAAPVSQLSGVELAAVIQLDEVQMSPLYPEECPFEEGMIGLAPFKEAARKEWRRRHPERELPAYMTGMPGRNFSLVAA